MTIPSSIPSATPGAPDPDDSEPTEADVHRVVSAGPTGAFAVAGVATAIVVLIYLAFWFFIHVPRGMVQ
ncbi:hypothetical protein [Cupriavidus lacunae]|uniref:Uncharacterized protein n=1 Tax=Cupriavidus lacunae TaxID=2666307 RepID=A0A370NNJ0_9BURK|nr:hypothetical protein [Cupriavidus lacunae]RDK07181.1 hypothetical protein DN412_27235 [Cupriavidus lacunae]